MLACSFCPSLRLRCWMPTRNHSLVFCSKRILCANLLLDFIIIVVTCFFFTSHQPCARSDLVFPTTVINVRLIINKFLLCFKVTEAFISESYQCHGLLIPNSGNDYNYWRAGLSPIWLNECKQKILQFYFIRAMVGMKKCRMIEIW